MLLTDKAPRDMHLRIHQGIHHICFDVQFFFPGVCPAILRSLDHIRREPSDLDCKATADCIVGEAPDDDAGECISCISLQPLPCYHYSVKAKILMPFP